MIKSKWKYVILSGMILLLPTSVYLKNDMLFDHFSSSSWLGMNLYWHIPHDAERTISQVRRFRKLNMYKDTQYWSLIEEKSKKYNYDHPSLKQGDFNDYRYIAISQLYLVDVKKNIDWLNSFQYFGDGILRFFESPANYGKFLLPVSQHFPVHDVFDLPNITIFGKKYLISWYTILYISMILYYLIMFRKQDFVTRYLFVYLMLFSVISIGVDNGESMRMRFEIESIYLFLFILMLNNIFTYFRTFTKSVPGSIKELK